VFVAAEHGHGRLVSVLHSLGTDVTTPMNDGATPLCMAAQNGREAVVRTLRM
jgi:ankyrin repeat protein